MERGYGGFGIRPRAPGNARHPLPGMLEQESNQRIMAAAQAAMAEPFVGLTADGRVAPGLYALQQTGVSTAPIQEAAEAFLAALDDQTASRAQFAIDGQEWRQWANNTRPIGRH